jgi:TolA-binding protein
MFRCKPCGGWILFLLPVLAAFPAAGFDNGRGDEADLQHYQAANGLLQRGLFDLAVEEYRAFLRDHAEHEKAPVAHYGLAVCLFRTGKYAAAIDELEPLAKDRTFEFAADVLTMLGQCKAAAGDFDAAARALGRVIEEHGDHKLAAEAGTQLAEVLFKAGKAEDASARCKMVAKRWPEAPQVERVCFIAAMAEMASSHYAEASPHLETLIDRFPKSASRLQADLLLAQCRHHLDRTDEAIGLYREVLKARESPLRPEALYGLAMLLLQKGDAAESVRLLDELIENNPSSPLLSAAYLLRGRAWFEANSFEAAQKSFELASQAAPDSADEPAY